MKRVRVICPQRLPAAASLSAPSASRAVQLTQPKGAAMYPVLSRLLAAGSGSNIQLDPSQAGLLPGETVLENLASGVGHWALLAAIVGVIIGGVMWAFGHFSHNYQQSYSGRRGVIVSGVAALLIGAASEIISFFFSLGVSIKN